MIVEKDNVIGVSFELKTGSPEKLFDKVDDDKPLEFLFTKSGFPPKFEETLAGKKAGDEFDFTLSADEGFGQLNDQAIVKIPKTVVNVEGVIQEELLVVDNFIPMTGENGDRLNGRVSALEGEDVIMDFNHPLAGKDIHFTGKIQHIRKAEAEEIEHGHIHQAHGCEDGDCDSGCDCN